MTTYPTYALRLPSGRSVLVRKPHAAVLLAENRLLLPLLSLAAIAVSQDDEPRAPAKPLEAIRHYCEVALVSPRMPQEIGFEDIAFSDALAIYQWAVMDDGAATPCGMRTWNAMDLAPLIRGEGALYLDLLCSRYHQRPSVCLGVDEAPWSLDLDLAVAYRGLKRESDGASGEVEVEDMFGGKHRVPAHWLAQSDVERGGRVMRAETLTGEMALSVGGDGGDGQLGPMPTAGGFSRSGWA